MSTTLSSDDRYTGLKLPPVSVGAPPPLPKPLPPLPARPAQPEPENELELVRRVRMLEEERETLLARVARFEERELSLSQAAQAIQAQRDKLIAVREEYEERRQLLVERAAEVDRERSRLRDAEEDLEERLRRLEDRERWLAGRQAALVEPEVGSASVEPEPVEPERRPVLPKLPKLAVPANFGPPRGGEWWARNLGRPLEAA